MIRKRDIIRMRRRRREHYAFALAQLLFLADDADVFASALAVLELSAGRYPTPPRNPREERVPMFPEMH